LDIGKDRLQWPGTAAIRTTGTRYMTDGIGEYYGRSWA
jgi:hypothetical protein